jgi:(S)-2-hydroxy-acid oxidase
VSLFGTTWDSPIVLAPVAAQRAFHPDGELAVARAARARKHLMILSTVGTASVEETGAARGEPVWFQLYPTDRWPIAQALVKRAQAAGCPALVLTVDLQGGTNRVAGERARRLDRRDCASCHGESLDRFDAYLARKPMFAGLDVSKATDLTAFDMTWDYLKQLRDLWPRKLLVKGIVTREDAQLALQCGVDGLIVSNHGGRAEESGRAAIESLVEVVGGVQGKLPVLVDGGFRRGTDVFKALALGARAVCIGRPYVWGLAAFGQAGVESVLGILRRELTTVMRQAGTRSLAEIDRSYVVRSGD